MGKLPRLQHWCVQAAVAAVEGLAGAAGVRLSRLDRRAERALVSAHTQGLRAQLTREQDPAAALWQAVPILLAQARLIWHPP